jgi:hypothetical protein
LRAAKRHARFATPGRFFWNSIEIAPDEGWQDRELDREKGFLGSVRQLSWLEWRKPRIIVGNADRTCRSKRSWRNQHRPDRDWRYEARLVVLASGYPQDRDALLIRADARILGATMTAGERIAYPLGKARRGYLVPSTGRVDVNGVRLAARDGALIRDEADLTLTALEDTELVLVDVA